MKALHPDESREIAETRAWVNRVVIGLNLCPFAKAPQVKGRVRYVTSDAVRTEDLLTALIDELKLLAAAPMDEVETTMLIHPRVLNDFVLYNDFFDVAEGALDALGLVGTLQLASFHPQYQFAGTSPHDVTNATNRSPYPMLHLIREDSIDRAVAAFPDAERIYKTNMDTMRRLGAEGLSALLKQCRDDAERTDR